MSNGIGIRQNEEKSIAMLAAQRQLYNEVGKLDLVNSVLLVALPLLLAILQEIGTPWSWIRNLSYGLSLSMLLISVSLEKTCKNKKATAAAIQLAFDTHVFSMPWDNRLFGKKRNLNDVIAEKSRGILAKEEEEKKLKNWYTEVVDQMPLEKGIFVCQKESCHWDFGLRRRYRIAAVATIAVLTGIVFFIGIVKNEPFQELLARCVFILPMLRWIVTIISGVSDDLNRLREIEQEFNSVEMKSMTDLQMIQKSLTDHRKAAVKIPNFVYWIFKNRDEDNEHRIATMDAEL